MKVKIWDVCCDVQFAYIIPGYLCMQEVIIIYFASMCAHLFIHLKTYKKKKECILLDLMDFIVSWNFKLMLAKCLRPFIVLPL